MTSTNKLRQNLIYDKIGFTLPIDENKRLLLLNRINDPGFYEPYKRKVYRNTGGRYKNNYQFEIYKGNTIELSLYPINKSHNFLRVEYNPAQLRKNGRKALREFLIKLLTISIVEKIYFHARITRLDLTLDVFDMEPDLYLHRNKMRQSKIIRVGFREKIITQILGSDLSCRRITKYDKSFEQGLDDEDINYQRIEIRLRNLGCTMAELSDDLLSEIKQLNFFKGKFLKDSRFSKKFIKDAYENNLNAALIRLDDNKRRCYLRYLKKDYRAHPISLHPSDLDFDKAHKQALGSLISVKYQKHFLNQVV